LGEGLESDFESCSVFLNGQASPVNVMKLMEVSLAGWINQQQEDVVDYLREEVRILKELNGKKRLRFTDEEQSQRS
jgi:hypothetical protein